MTVFGWTYWRHSPTTMPEPSASDQITRDGRWHLVAHGESLRSISRRYYGSARLWRSLQVSNDSGQYPVPGSRIWVPGLQPDLP